MNQAPEASGLVELGGCEGCALGCAVTCADGREDRAVEARRVLVGSGLGLVILSVGPGLVSRQVAVLGLALTTALLGAAVAVLAGVALRAGRPGGDRAARAAYRLLPAGIVGMLSTGLGAVLARLL